MKLKIIQIKHLTAFLIIVASLNSGAQSNQIELECSGLGSIAITRGRNYLISDSVNAGNFTYYVTIKNDSITINDTTLKNIPQKFSSTDGYSEYGHFVIKDSEYFGSNAYEYGEKSYKEIDGIPNSTPVDPNNYRFTEHRLTLYRLSGQFNYKKTFYLNNLLDNQNYFKYNIKKRKDAYVNLDVNGICRKATGKQKF